MSAAVGHLSHLVEGRDLKVAEIKQILSDAYHARLNGVTEKFDGMNLVFTWDINVDQLRVARKASDIPAGGMDAPALAARFAGRGNVELAFNDAFRVLNAAILALTHEERLVAFGTNAYRWYSIEIIHQAALNTIKYNGNHIIFHSWPVFERSPGGVLRGIKDSLGVKIFTNAIERMHAQVSALGFEVHGPAIVKLIPREDERFLELALNQIDSALNRFHLADDVKLVDYLCSAGLYSAGNCSSVNSRQELALKLADHPQALHANDVKKLFPKNQVPQVTKMMQDREEFQTGWLIPIERAIFHIATEVLKDVPSMLIKDSPAEVKRLRTKVADTIDEVCISQNQEAINFVRKQIQLMEHINNISSPMEGIVFMYGDEAYKLTGAFAFAHQIIATLKYGRKAPTNERKHVQGHQPDLIRRA